MIDDTLSQPTASRDAVDVEAAVEACRLIEHGRADDISDHQRYSLLLAGLLEDRHRLERELLWPLAFKATRRDFAEWHKEHREDATRIPARLWRTITRLRPDQFPNFLDRLRQGAPAEEVALAAHVIGRAGPTSAKQFAGSRRTAPSRWRQPHHRSPLRHPRPRPRQSNGVLGSEHRSPSRPSQQPKPPSGPPCSTGRARRRGDGSAMASIPAAMEIRS